MACASENYLRKIEGEYPSNRWPRTPKRVDHANCAKKRRKTLRAPRIAAPSPLTHCRTRARASAAPNDARTQAKNKSSPKMISKPKLITALALLALHGAAGDDLCAPASTSVARRVYAVARRARRDASPRYNLVGLRRPRRRPRPRRRRPRRPCRAGGYGVKFNVPSKPGTLQTESKSGAASAAHRLRSGLPVDRTTPRRLAVGPATRGLPAGCPGAPSNT